MSTCKKLIPSIGTLLRKARVRSNASLSAMSTLTGMSTEKIEAIEGGSVDDLQIEELIIICNILSLRVSDIIEAAELLASS